MPPATAPPRSGHPGNANAYRRPAQGPPRRRLLGGHPRVYAARWRPTVHQRESGCAVWFCGLSPPSPRHAAGPGRSAPQQKRRRRQKGDCAAGDALRALSSAAADAASGTAAAARRVGPSALTGAALPPRLAVVLCIAGAAAGHALQALVVGGPAAEYAQEFFVPCPRAPYHALPVDHAYV